MSTTNTNASLYKRLGGYDVIAAVVDDLFQMLRSDPRFSRFGMGRSMDSHQRARQLLVDQLCQLAGGPCFYIGRDMKTSHAGLGITQEEWEVNLDYTRQALRKHGIGQRESDEVIAVFERYRSEIVEVSTSARQASGRD
jgi:hemoglobin